MIHVYYSSVGAESAKLLVERIAELGAPVEIHRQKYGRFEHTKNDLLVNWGATCPDKLNTQNRWLNRGVYFNKYYHLEVLNDHDVPVAPHTRYKPMNGKWYARMFEHRDGSDLAQKLTNGEYYVQHVDTVREFRVHVFAGQILRASEKVPLDSRADKVIRTGDYWGFSSKDWGPHLPAASVEACLKAVAVLGYDFGGVDLGITSDKGKPIVFEVNAAPWLGGDASRRYAKKIVSMV